MTRCCPRSTPRKGSPSAPLYKPSYYSIKQRIHPSLQRHLLAAPLLPLQQHRLDLLHQLVRLQLLPHRHVRLLHYPPQRLFRVAQPALRQHFLLLLVVLLAVLAQRNHHVLVVLDQHLDDVAGVDNLLRRFPLAGQQFVHLVVEVGDVLEDLFGDADAELVGVDEGEAVPGLVGVEERLEELLDLVVDVVDLSLDVLDHLLLGDRLDQLLLVLLQLLRHLVGQLRRGVEDLLVLGFQAVQRSDDLVLYSE